jgi:hypothetical protein
MAVMHRRRAASRRPQAGRAAVAPHLTARSSDAARGGGEDVMSLSHPPFEGEGGHEPPAMPWDRRPSILEFLRSRLRGDPKASAGGGDTLPDEERFARGSKVRLVAGGMDGMTLYHLGLRPDREATRAGVRLVRAYCRQPTAANMAAVYRYAAIGPVLSLVGPVVAALGRWKGARCGRLYELARSLATEAPDREPVKLGLGLLSLFGRPADRDVFRTLGRHDEFTLFCAAAFVRLMEDPDREVWALAQGVRGWGRIHAVATLARTADPAIRDWMLREGFRNSVNHAYLAGICARAGGLLAALSREHVDRPLLTAAGEIVEGLVAGRPAGIGDDYPDARPAIAAYLGHMAACAETVGDFLHVTAVWRYLGEYGIRRAGRCGGSWTAAFRNRLRARCASILVRPEWPDRVRAQLQSAEDGELAQAHRAAEALGIDTWDVHWRRLQQEPADPARWCLAMAASDEGRVGRVLALAEATLDLAGIATGAADEFGREPGFERHRCLDYILDELHRFPGRGERLIEAGLRSPVITNRFVAAAAAAAWPRAEWPDGLEGALRRAARCEPDKVIRAQMEQALRGGPRPP